MPRVTHVKAARKDNPVAKKGESYFWWKFRYGGKRYSLTRPRQSQLTQSAYFGTLYAALENIEDWTGESYEDFESLVEEVRGELENLSEETQSSLDNMPDSLQYSPTGELLQERVDALDTAASDVEYVDEFDFDEEDFDDSDYASDEEMKADKEEHESQEAERRTDEFSSWLDDAKSVLTEAIDQAIV